MAHRTTPAFDLLNLPADFVPRAYDYFAELRGVSPVHANSDGSLVLTRFDDIVAVYRDTALWRSDKRAAFGPRFGNSPLFEHHTTSLVFRDPPDHTRIRKLFQHAFTRKALAVLEGRIEALVDGYLDQLEDQGGMEFVSEFSFRLPLEVVADMLGVPSEDRELIRDWALLILGALEPTISKAEFDAGCEAVEDFKAYLRAQMAIRRRDPSARREGEILSDLMAAEEDGEKLTELELLHQCIFLLNAGHETSTNMMSHGLIAFLENPTEIQRLTEDASLIDSAVEEVLRYQAPIQINNRQAAADTEIGGAPVPAGTTVHMMLGAGNRDPAQFPDPDRFDITRRPNRHLSFGLGVHICAGNALARLEASITFQKLFERFPKLQLTDAPKLANRVRFREVAELQVTL